MLNAPPLPTRYTTRCGTPSVVLAVPPGCQIAEHREIFLTEGSQASHLIEWCSISAD